MGRWGSRDPLGERGGLNLYVFVRNDSINLIDPLGWWDLIQSTRYFHGQPIKTPQLEGPDLQSIWNKVTSYDPNEQIPAAIGLNAGLFFGLYLERGIIFGANSAAILFPDTCEIGFYAVTAGLGDAAKEGRRMIREDKGKDFERLGLAASLGGGAEVAIWVGNNNPRTASAKSFEGTFHTASFGFPAGAGASGYIGDRSETTGGNWIGGTLTGAVGGGSAMVDWKYTFITGDYSSSVVQLENYETGKCLCHIVRNALKEAGVKNVQQAINEGGYQELLEKIVMDVQKKEIVPPLLPPSKY